MVCSAADLAMQAGGDILSAMSPTAAEQAQPD
jgi:hypothetical protein